MSTSPTDIVSAAIERYNNDAEFHARVHRSVSTLASALKANSSAAEPNDDELLIMRTSAAVALQLDDLTFFGAIDAPFNGVPT